MERLEHTNCNFWKICVLCSQFIIIHKHDLPLKFCANYDHPAQNGNLSATGINIPNQPPTPPPPPPSAPPHPSYMPLIIVRLLP